MNQVKNIEVEVRSIFKLYAEGKFEQGLRRSLALQKAAPKLAISNYCVGHGYGALGRLRVAETYLRKASQLEPRNVEFLIRLGKILLDSGRVDAAQNILTRARELNSKLPMVPLTLGIFYSSIDRFDLAVGFFQEVFAGDAPEEIKKGAMTSWARALIEVGRNSEAEMILHGMIEKSIETGPALIELSEISPLVHGSREFEILEEQINSLAIPDRDKAILLVAKSRTLAASGNSSTELDCLIRSKDLRGAADVSSRFGGYVDEMIATFSSHSIRAITEFAGVTNFSPIHVVGLPRSGTTLTERILSSHSMVGGAGELQAVPNFLNDLLDGRPLSELNSRVPALGAFKMKERVNEVINTMKFLRPDKERIIDKMPHNFLLCGLISALFPSGSIVHCFRHPADNFMSGFKANLADAHSYFHRPEWFVVYYQHYVRLMKHWRHVLPGRVFNSSYERLVTEPEIAIREILEYCGLGWEENCLHPELESSRIGTASLVQARSPINPKSVGGWKKYASFLETIIQNCNVDALESN